MGKVAASVDSPFSTFRKATATVARKAYHAVDSFSYYVRLSWINDDLCYLNLMGVEEVEPDSVFSDAQMQQMESLSLLTYDSEK